VRILVVGANGQLGRDCIKLFSPASGPQRSVLDLRPFPGSAACEEVRGLDLPDIDITEPASIAAALDAFRPDAVVNCAAYTRVDDAESHEDLCRKKTGDIIRSVRKARKAPGEDRIYVAGEKEYGIWKERESRGVPINESVQGEINAVRDQLGLNYVFPWEDGYKGYSSDRKISAHIERK